MPHAPLSPFRRAAAEAVAAALGVDAATLPVSTPPDPAMGDYAVGCFPAAKALKAAPPQLAAKAAAAFQPTALLASAKAAGPYVNFRADRGALYAHLLSVTLPDGATPIPTTLGGGPGAAPGDQKTVCVDFSSPNIAKHLSYHHIRSTVIGQALVNLNRALGFRVVGINHLGDWGTTFGMLLAAEEKWGQPEPLTIGALNDLYVRYRAAEKAGEVAPETARAWFKRLEDGDPVARARWQAHRDVSWKEFQEVYNALGSKFDEVRGESDYESAMPGVVTMLGQKGLTSISEGALVVDLTDEKMPPCLLKKEDGATLYATRDLAAAMYRWDNYHFERSLYVVDKGQSLHFAQLKAVLAKAGFAWSTRMTHVPFGLVRIGGKKSGTRTGNVVLLKDVLAEAGERVLQRMRASNPELDPAVAASAARDVGIGAIVFANLITQREKDQDFELDAILSFEGDTGPYVQYAHARTASLLARGGVARTAELVGADPALLVRDEEWALAKLLTDLPDETARAAESDEPHGVCRYLLDVCAAFSRWYTLGNQDPSLKVLGGDPATQRARLALTAATRTTLKTGLALLGMNAPDQM